MRAAGKFWDGDGTGDELGARTLMEQEGKRLKMPSEDVVLPGEDGRYLVKACSAYVSCLRSLPSKTQPRGE